MNSLFLNKKNNNKLILFFNGWSLDENIVKDLTTSEYDVIMFYDYSNLEIDENIVKEINSYKEINIVAFSFGVWACGYVLRHCEALNVGSDIECLPKQSCLLLQNINSRFKNVIAINGTLIPIDDKFGIPEKIFNLTLSTLSEKTYPRFFKNMFSGEADVDLHSKSNLKWKSKVGLPAHQQKVDNALNASQYDLEKFPNRTIENQRQELIQIKDLSTDKNCAQNSNLFTKIFVGTNDKIIPAKNQMAFWGKETKVIKKDFGHYMSFESWDEIIDA